MAQYKIVLGTTQSWGDVKTLFGQKFPELEAAFMGSDGPGHYFSLSIKGKEESKEAHEALINVLEPKLSRWFGHWKISEIKDQA